MKRAMLIYGPFTYVMEVQEFGRQVRILKPYGITQFIRGEPEFLSEASFKQLIFEPKGLTDKDVMTYLFVREE